MIKAIVFVIVTVIGGVAWELAGAPEPAPAQAIPREYELKAAFLYNFTQFVEWPTNAFAAPEAPLVIGVLGQDPFGPLLDGMVQNEIVRHRRLAVRRYTRVEEVDQCHLLFVSGSEAARLDQILKALQGRPILTVGETETFTRRGGMIRFISDRRIKLRINLEASRAAGLRISSNLLKLAEIVRTEE